MARVPGRNMKIDRDIQKVVDLFEKCMVESGVSRGRVEQVIALALLQIPNIKSKR
jgi:hypothetical protein